MNPQEVQNLKREYALLGAYFSQQLMDAVIAMYVRDLEDLEYQSVLRAMQELRREKGRRFAPLPADIREKVNPTVSSKSIADEVANRILGAFKRHGYTWPSGYALDGQKSWDARVNGRTQHFGTFREALFAEVGEVGYAALDRMGGYSSVCEEWGASSNITTLRAQIRDMANSVVEALRSGLPNGASALTGPEIRRLTGLNTPSRGEPGAGRALVAPDPEKLNSADSTGLQSVRDILNQKRNHEHTQ